MEYAEKIAAKYGVRSEWLIGFDDQKTLFDAAFEDAWASSCTAEDLLTTIGFNFVKTNGVKKVLKSYISEETGERKVFSEEDRDDPTAYRIILGGREVGQCSIHEYENLIASIVDKVIKKPAP